MFSEPITIRDAQMTSFHCKMSDGKLQTRIGISATLSQELADFLGAKSLVFRDNGTPRESFSSVALETGCSAFRAVFQGDPALKQSFELVTGDSTDAYSVKRMEEGILQLRFRLNYHGDVHGALGYFEALGDATSLLKITPLQTDITSAAKDDDEDDQETDDQDELFDEPIKEEKPEPARQKLISGRGRHSRKQAQA